MIEEVERMRNSGRPVLVGTSSVEISELLSRLLKLRHIPHQVLNAKLHQKEADIVAQAGKSTPGIVKIKDENGQVREEERLLGAVTIATNMAGRGTDIKLTDEVRAAGGLASSAPSDTTAVVSIASFVVVQVVKVTSEAPSSTFRSKTNSCVFSPPNALLVSWTSSVSRTAR